MLDDLNNIQEDSRVIDIAGSIQVDDKSFKEVHREITVSESLFIRNICGVRHRSDIDPKKIFTDERNFIFQKHVVKSLALRYALISLNSREMGIEENGLNLGIMNARKMVIFAANLSYEDTPNGVHDLIVEFASILKEKENPLHFDGVIEINGGIDYSRSRFDIIDNIFTNIESDLQKRFRSIPDNESSRIELQNLATIITEELLFFRVIGGLFSDDFSEVDYVADEDINVNSNIENINTNIFHLILFEQGTFADTLIIMNDLLESYLQDSLVPEEEEIDIKDKRSLSRLVAMIGLAKALIEKWISLHDQ